MKRYDVIVVGMGAVGSAALYQLSKSGVNVLGIDRFTPPHPHGSSYGESRVTRQAIGEDAAYSALSMRSDQIWNEMESLSGEILCERIGVLIGSYEQGRFYQNTLRAARERTIAHEILDGTDVERRFPAMTTRDSDLAFYYEPGGGYLRPEKCVEVNLRAARDNGAETLLNTVVASIDESADSVRIQTADGVDLLAGKVIITTGPWMAQLVGDALQPILRTVCQTLYWFDFEQQHYDMFKPGAMPILLAGVERKAVTRSFYGFPALSGPGGGIKFAFHETDVAVDPDMKDEVTLGKANQEELYDYIRQFVRYVRPEPLRSFNCVYTMTPDEKFIIDHAPGSQRIVFASACSGHGFKYSAATGEIAAQLATDVEPSIDMAQLALSRTSLTSI